jgi:hypothetical protein
LHNVRRTRPKRGTLFFIFHRVLGCGCCGLAFHIFIPNLRRDFASLNMAKIVNMAIETARQIRTRALNNLINLIAEFL